MSAVATAAPLLVYFSSVSGNTARFIEKLGFPSRRILHRNEEDLVIDEPFVLVTPPTAGERGGASRRAPFRNR